MDTDAWTGREDKESEGWATEYVPAGPETEQRRCQYPPRNERTTTGPRTRLEVVRKAKGGEGWKWNRIEDLKWSQKRLIRVRRRAETGVLDGRNEPVIFVPC